MAQREYEMLFQLNAKLGSQYSSTLRSAQSELTRVRVEYRDLSRTVNDVAAYQRQQNAVENTKSKLELLQTQYDNIQREMEETGGFSSDLANKLAAKKAQIEKTSKAYEEQARKLEEYKRVLEAAGVDTSDLDKELARLRDELKRTKEGFDEGKKGAKEFGDEGKDAVEELGAAIAAVGITKLMKEIYDAFAACVKVAADFEATMSDVEAISGANAEEIAALTERAKELGASTSFTAQQVSEGMTFMSMAGWKTEDMLAGMDAVLALAAASGEDLGTTSDIVTDALTAFGLTAKDTGRFADVLAAASSNANTNVGMMGETFKYAAPVAGALGYSVEDVAVAIGLMANSGIKASQAGTTLRNIFNGLLGGVDLTGKAFGEVSVTFENTDGTMMDLASSINVLRGYFEQMTEAERVHNAINIAGQRGYSGLLAILNSTTADYDKLTDAINNSSGAAQRMADIKLDNLNGQMTIAKSAAEGMKIALGEQFTPVLTKLYKILGDIFGGITNFIKQNPTLTKAIVALTIGVAAFVAGLVIYITVSKLAKAATEALTAAMSTNPYLLLGAAIAGITVALVSLAALDSEAEEEQEKLTASSQAQREEMERLEAEYKKVCEAQGEASADALLLKDSLDKATSSYETNKKTVQELYEEIENNATEGQEMASAHKDTIEALDLEIAGTENLVERLFSLTSAEEMTAAAKEQVVAIVDLLNQRIPELGLNYDILTGKINMTKDEIIDLARQQNNSAQWRTNYEALQKELDIEESRRQAYEEAVATQKAAEENQKRLAASYKSAWENYNTWLQSATQTEMRTSGRTAPSRDALDQAERDLDDANSALSSAKEEFERNQAAIEDLSGSLATIDEETGASMDVVATAIGNYQEKIDALNEAYNAVYDAAYQSISGQYKMWDEVAEVSATSVDSVIGNLEKQKQYWEDYNSNIQLLLSYSGEIEGLSDMVAEFGDGSAESVNMIAGMAEAARSGDPAAIQSLVTAWQDNKAAQDEAAQSLADLTTNYSVEMDKIGQEIASDVSELDHSSEAVTAGENTIQGFIDGAKNMLPAVQRAYAGIGQAARDALGSGGAPTTGYAVGTTSAKRGFAYVGENGPELVWFDGGESVMTADETAEYLRAIRDDGIEPVSASTTSSSSRYQISFSPTYNLSGAADSEEIRTILSEHDAELVRQVREMLEEEEEDRVRRRM